MKTLAILLAAGCACAATAPGDLDRLVAETRAVSPEIAADALLRLSALENISPARRMELVEQAFQRASQAQSRYKLRAAFASAPSAAFLNKAYAQNLDALDLEVRAVEAMSALDAAKARELFQEIPPIGFPAVKCAAWAVYDVDSYYREMASLGRTFTGAERKSGGPARFLEPYAGAIGSAVEAGPMAEALAAAGVSDAEFAKLVAAFAGALGKIVGDDRSFTSAKRLGPRIEALAAECRRRQISPLPLLESYRYFLVANLSGVRCADEGRMEGMVMSALADTAAARQPENPAQFFNERLQAPPLQPIQEQEATPFRVEGQAADEGSCGDEVCRSLAGQCRGLLFGSDGDVLPPAKRAGAEWTARLKKVLATLAQWQAGRADAAGHFREKASAYNELLSVASGEARRMVAAAELDFLLHAQSQAANRIEWFLPLNQLLAWTALDPAGLREFGEKLRQSADPVVALYAELEAFAPRRPEQLVPLL